MEAQAREILSLSLYAYTNPKLSSATARIAGPGAIAVPCKSFLGPGQDLYVHVHIYANLPSEAGIRKRGRICMAKWKCRASERALKGFRPLLCVRAWLLLYCARAPAWGIRNCRGFLLFVEATCCCCFFFVFLLGGREVHKFRCCRECACVVGELGGEWR